jgi:hypothetical protein
MYLSDKELVDLITVNSNFISRTYIHRPIMVMVLTQISIGFTQINYLYLITTAVTNREFAG